MNSVHELAGAAEPRAGMGRIFDILEGPDVTEVILIRHGHVPPSGIEEDPPLSETGRDQAAVLGDFLALQPPLHAVYSSPLRRTLETAEALACRQTLSVEALEDLRDMVLDLPAGTSMQDVIASAEWQEAQARVLQDRRWEVLSEYFEPRDRLRERSVRAVETAIEAHAGGRVALVTHGPVIMAYVAALLECAIDLVFMPRLTSITVVRAADGHRGLYLLNSIAHFGRL